MCNWFLDHFYLSIWGFFPHFNTRRHLANAKLTTSSSMPHCSQQFNWMLNENRNIVICRFFSQFFFGLRFTCKKCDFEFLSEKHLKKWAREREKSFYYHRLCPKKKRRLFWILKCASTMRTSLSCSTTFHISYLTDPLVDQQAAQCAFLVLQYTALCGKHFIGKFISILIIAWEFINWQFYFSLIVPTSFSRLTE